MKTLSIIGLVLSFIGVLWSILAILIILSTSHNQGDVIITLTPLLIINIFFLAFSIIATVHSFKKNN